MTSALKPAFRKLWNNPKVPNNNDINLVTEKQHKKKGGGCLLIRTFHALLDSGPKTNFFQLIITVSLETKSLAVIFLTLIPMATNQISGV